MLPILIKGDDLKMLFKNPIDIKKDLVIRNKQKLPEIFNYRDNLVKGYNSSINVLKYNDTKDEGDLLNINTILNDIFFKFDFLEKIDKLKKLQTSFAFDYESFKKYIEITELEPYEVSMDEYNENLLANKNNLSNYMNSVNLFKHDTLNTIDNLKNEIINNNTFSIFTNLFITMLSDDITKESITDNIDKVYMALKKEKKVIVIDNAKFKELTNVALNPIRSDELYRMSESIYEFKDRIVNYVSEWKDMYNYLNITPESVSDTQKSLLDSTDEYERIKIYKIFPVILNILCTYLSITIDIEMDKINTYHKILEHTIKKFKNDVNNINFVSTL